MIKVSLLQQTLWFDKSFLFPLFHSHVNKKVNKHVSWQEYCTEQHAFSQDHCPEVCSFLKRFDLSKLRKLVRILWLNVYKSQNSFPITAGLATTRGIQCHCLKFPHLYFLFSRSIHVCALHRCSLKLGYQEHQGLNFQSMFF